MTDTSAGDDELFRLLVDPMTRSILRAVDTDRRSAKELAEQCDVSGPTMYRKVNTMQEYNLLTEGTEIDRDGNHYTVYESNVETIQMAIDPSKETPEINVSYRSTTEQFIHLWEGLKE